MNIRTVILRNNLALLGCFFILGGCLPDRTFPGPDPGLIRVLRPGLIRINEIQPAGNTPGEPGDWVELINTGDSAVEVGPGSFRITRSKAGGLSYSPLQRYTIPPRGFLSVFFAEGVSDNSGEWIVCPGGGLPEMGGGFAGFYFVRGPGDTLVLDTASFPAQPAGRPTFGRLPDGSGSFRWLSVASRNKPNNSVASGDIPPGKDRLIINEIDPNGAPDWFELVNPYPDSIMLKAGQWFFTDDTTQKEKYAIPVDFMMAGGRYAIVECNTYGPDADAGQLRAKFSLSSAGESVALYYRNSSGKMECIQKVDFPYGIPTGKTIARRPDLSGPFGQSESPSRGLPNP